jgi:flavin reductase (DIM6/NTAB) family NADH-FMN oxidoreductase RutF
MSDARVFSRRVFLAGAAGSVGVPSLVQASTGGLPHPQGGRVTLREPGPMVPPVPAVLLTVNGMPGDPDEITVLWTFIVNGDPPQVGVAAAHGHIAGELISHHGEFVLNVPVADIVVPFDRVDMNSSHVGDKFELSGLTRGSAAVVDAPTVAECPIQVECRVFDTIDVPPMRTIFLADVVATTVLEGVVDENERLIVADVPFFGMTAGSGEFCTMDRAVGHIGQTVGRSDIRY